jgi:hypothetical protein
MTEHSEAIPAQGQPSSEEPRSKSTASAKGGQAKKRPSKAGASKARPSQAAVPSTGKSTSPTERALGGINEVRHYFRTSVEPIFFVGATPFAFLGLDQWISGLSYVAYYDAWDGAHPRVFTPVSKPHVDFQSGAEITNWLLSNLEVQAHIARSTHPGARPGIVTSAADAETEQLCAELGYDLLMSSIHVRENAYAAVMDSAVEQPTAPPREGEGEASTEEPIRWSNVAIEAVVTRQGILVGPSMTGLVGDPGLTPLPDLWCGDELAPDALSDDNREKAAELVRTVGAHLQSHGYRGYFEVDLLVEAQAGQVSVGEVTLGVSGATALTHLSAVAHADAPLFLFHLLELLDVAVDIDVDEVNRRWVDLAASDSWSLMVVKQTDPIFDQITVAAPTGQYTLDANGALVFRHAALDWHQLRDESEAFWLRIYGPGSYRWQGCDLGVLVVRGPVRQTSGERAGALTPRAELMVDSIRAHFAGAPLALVS